MDTDVYVLCPWCKQICPGKGSGEMLDEIECSFCKNKMVASKIMKEYSDSSYSGQQKASMGKLKCKNLIDADDTTEKCRDLYIPRGFKINEGEFSR